MHAIAVRHRSFVRPAEESCACGAGPVVSVLPIDGEERPVCDECLGTYSDLIQVPDAPTDARGVAILNA